MPFSSASTLINCSNDNSVFIDQLSFISLSGIFIKMHNSFYFIITFIRSCNFRNADIRTLLIICFLLIKLSITVNILNSIVACTVCIRYQSIFVLSVIHALNIKSLPNASPSSTPASLLNSSKISLIGLLSL